MIYELAICVKSEFSEDAIVNMTEVFMSTIKNGGGNILVADDWGTLTLAQETRKRVKSVRILYFIYNAKGSVNRELVRRLRITEGIVRHMIVKLGPEDKADAIIKNIKIVFSKKYPGSVTDSNNDVVGGHRGEDDRDRRKFSRNRTCYFISKGIKADWKDPKTFMWLVNEFGKIIPARVSNISRKHQRFVTTAIKRARHMGLIGYMSNYVMRPR